MEQNDRKIVGHYKFNSSAVEPYWSELSGLVAPVRQVFGKFALKGVIIILGQDILEALENSGRQTSSFEHFRNGYLTPPDGIGRLSLDVRNQGMD